MLLLSRASPFVKDQAKTLYSFSLCVPGSPARITASIQDLLVPHRLLLLFQMRLLIAHLQLQIIRLIKGSGKRVPQDFGESNALSFISLNSITLLNSLAPKRDAFPYWK